MARRISIYPQHFFKGIRTKRPHRKVTEPLRRKSVSRCDFRDRLSVLPPVGCHSCSCGRRRVDVRPEHIYLLDSVPSYFC